MMTETFLRAGDIPVNRNHFTIETANRPDLDKESFIIETDCFVANKLRDTEGIRRGIFYLEDQMLSVKGPFLKIGTFKNNGYTEKNFRCAFGPIKAPLMRDELMIPLIIPTIT